jgi:hypothetical protein
MRHGRSPSPRAESTMACQRVLVTVVAVVAASSSSALPNRLASSISGTMEAVADARMSPSAMVITAPPFLLLR